MNIQFVHAPLHTAEQVRAIIVEAGAIAHELGADDAERHAIFDKAVDLLGARVSAPLMEQPVPLALPRMDIPRNHR
jgi:hypothetical protein